jgi:hypothetical protein
MQKKLAVFFSALFHPLFMPSICLLIIFNSGTYLSYMPYELKRLIFILVLVLTLVLPLAILPLLKLQRLIGDYTMSSRKERLLPLLFTFLFYGFGYYLIQRVSLVPRFIQLTVLATAILVLLSLLVSLKWKISLHMLGVGGLTGIVLALLPLQASHAPYFLGLVFLMAGITGTSRLILKAHVPPQVYAGYFLGVFTMFGVLVYF